MQAWSGGLGFDMSKAYAKLDENGDGNTSVSEQPIPVDTPSKLAVYP